MAQVSGGFARAMTLLFGISADPTGFIKGTDDASKAAISLGTQLGKMGKKNRNMLSNMSTGLNVSGSVMRNIGGEVANFGKIFTGVIGASIDEAVAFEKVFAGLAVIVGDETPDALDRLRDKAVQTGIETIFSPKQAVEGLTILRQNLGNTTDAIAALDPALNLVAASMGKLSLEQGSGVMADAMASFGLGANELEGFSSQVVRTVQLSRVNFEDLTKAINKMGDAPRKFSNTSRESFLAMAAAGRAFGSSADLVGQDIQAMASSLNNLTREQFEMIRGTQRTKALARAGIQFSDLVDSSGRYKDMLEILTIMNEKFAQSGIGPEEQIATMQTLFQKAGGRMANSIINARAELGGLTGEANNGVGAVQALAAQLKAAGGNGDVAAAAAEAYKDTLAGSLELLRGTIDTFKGLFGEVLLKPLTKMLNFFTDFLNVILRAVQQSKVLRVAFLGVVGAFGLGLIVTGLLISAMGVLQITVGTAMQSLLGLTFAMEKYNEQVAVGMISDLKTLGGSGKGLLGRTIKGFKMLMGVMRAAAWPLAILSVGLVGLKISAAGSEEGADSMGESFDRLRRGLSLFADFIRQGLGGDQKIDFGVGQALQRFPKLFDFAVMLVAFGKRLQSAWQGFKEGLGFILQPEFAETVGILFDSIINSVSKLLGIEPPTGEDTFFNLAFWRKIGQGVGAFVGVFVALATGVVIGIEAIVAAWVWLMSNFKAARNIWLALTAPLLFPFKMMYELITSIIDAIGTMNRLWDASMTGGVAGAIADAGGTVPSADTGQTGAAGAAPDPRIPGNPGHELYQRNMATRLETSRTTPDLRTSDQPGSAQVTVNLSDMKFSAEKLGEQEAEEFAKMVAEKMANEISMQTTAEL